VSLKKFITAVITFIVLILIMVGIGTVVWHLIRPQFDNLRNRDNHDVIPFHDHFDLDPDIPHIILEGRRIRDTDINQPLVHNGIAYLPVCFIREFIDPFMFWDTGAQTLFVTTRHEMRAYRHGDIRVADGVPFVPADLVMGLYPFTVSYHPKYNMIVVTDDRQPQTTAAITTLTPVRYRPDPQAPITVNLNPGDQITVFWDANDGPDRFWTRVRTGNGLLGYVQTSLLGATESRSNAAARTSVLGDFIDNLQPRTPNWTGGKINLVWENPYTVAASVTNMQTPLHESLTVVSPTWFRFNAETRELDSVANAEYVQWAHEQGIQVWPNVTDTSAHPGITDILSDAAARRRVIEQLVHYVDTLGLDGLCINIESIIHFRYGPYFVQFMRELNIALGHRIPIMAAMKPDISINPHYRHDLIALTVDFIALMAYNEHTMMTPGPVASLPWVRRRIEETLHLVPANQLILGVHFYNRVWRTAVSDNSWRPSAHWGMDRAVTDFYRHGVSWEEDAVIPWEWDPVVGSYYAEFAAVVDGETLRHQLWLECERSVAEKMRLFTEYDLAGIAGWSNEFTNQAVWDLIGRYFGWIPQE